MKNIEETIDFLNGKEINIKHPYADFTFIFNKPVMCGGTLYLSAWGLKGKVSFDGDKWFDVDSLKPNEEFYVEYFYETIVNDNVLTKVECSYDKLNEKNVVVKNIDEILVDYKK
jgi:hypothetical protein